MGYYDDPDVELLSKAWFFPLENQWFAGRQTTINLGDFTPWWDSNTLNWKLLIYARDRAWQMNQGLLANYSQVMAQWRQNEQDRPGQNGPAPQSPMAYIALTKYVIRQSSDGTVELDQNGNPAKMFYVFDVVPGSQPVSLVTTH